MTFLVVANFKSHKSSVEVESWLGEVAPVAKSAPFSVLVAPSFPHLSLLTGKPENRKTGLLTCAQNVSPYPAGSYTGEVNAGQLQDLGVTYCIVGHSERRHYFHETASDVANKVRELVAVGITPIICLDESDVAPQFAALDEESYAKCYYCFEPARGIGGTVASDTGTIERVKAKILGYFPDARFMYGGSVNEGNVVGLLPVAEYGFLISSASLEAPSFNTIIGSLSHAKTN